MAGVGSEVVDVQVEGWSMEVWRQSKGRNLILNYCFLPAFAGTCLSRLHKAIKDKEDWSFWWRHWDTGQLSSFEQDAIKQQLKHSEKILFRFLPKDWDGGQPTSQKPPEPGEFWGAHPAVSGLCHIFLPWLGSNLTWDQSQVRLWLGCAIPNTDVSQLEFSGDAWEKSDRKWCWWRSKSFLSQS